MDWIWSHQGIAVALSAAAVPPSPVAVGGVFYPGGAAMALSAVAATSSASLSTTSRAALSASASASGATQASFAPPAGAASTSVATGASVQAGTLAPSGGAGGSTSSTGNATGSTNLPVGVATAGASNSSSTAGTFLGPSAHLDLTTAVLSVVEIQATTPAPAAASGFAVGVVGGGGARALPGTTAAALSGASAGAIASTMRGADASVAAGASAPAGVVARHDVPAAALEHGALVGVFVDGVAQALAARLTILTGVVIMSADLEVAGVAMVPRAAAALLPWRPYVPSPGAPASRFEVPAARTQTVLVRVVGRQKGTRFS